MEAGQARRVALAVRRCQELELQRQPVRGVRARPTGDRPSGAMRTSAAAVAAVVLAVVIFYAVATSAGAS
jgi:hypothetical protein